MDKSSPIGTWFDAVSLRMSVEPNKPIAEHMYHAAQGLIAIQKSQRYWDDKLFISTVADMNHMMRNQYIFDTQKHTARDS